MKRLLPLLPLLLPPMAIAHHLAAPKVDLVFVSAREIRIATDYSVDPAKGDELRAVFDRDANGSLDEKERVAAEAWIRAAATNFLGATLDGKKLALTEIEAEMRGLDRAGDLGGMFVLSAPVSLGKGAHRLELVDRHKDAAIEVPVRVTFARGLSSEAGDAPLSVGGPVRSLAIDFHAQ